MTEEEAKTKWCPFVRYTEYMTNDETEDGIPAVINIPPPAHNRWSADGEGTGGEACEADQFLCIGSDCMAWRWDYDGASTTHGFCGLASKT